MCAEKGGTVGAFRGHSYVMQSDPFHSPVPTWHSKVRVLRVL